MVFILWGKPAQSKKSMLDPDKHLILEAPHPSPLSAYRGFFGSKPFSKTNAYLTAHGLEPIDWQIENRLSGYRRQIRYLPGFFHESRKNRKRDKAGVNDE